MEDFLEVAGQLLLFNVKGTKTLDTRSIYQIASIRQVYHLAEGGGVHTGIVGFADLCCTLSRMRYQLVD